MTRCISGRAYAARASRSRISVCNCVLCMDTYTDTLLGEDVKMWSNKNSQHMHVEHRARELAVAEHETHSPTSRDVCTVLKRTRHLAGRQPMVRGVRRCRCIDPPRCTSFCSSRATAVPGAVGLQCASPSHHHRPQGSLPPPPSKLSSSTTILHPPLPQEFIQAPLPVASSLRGSFW